MDWVVCPKDDIHGKIWDCCGSFTLSCTSSVIRPLESPITIHPHENLGDLQPIVSVCCLRSEHSPSAVSSVIRQMIDKAKGLTHQEELSLQGLLEEFSDIISSNSIDLGRSKLVKHKINTGDAIPVKQPFRWIPFHHRETVRSML